MVTYTHLYSCYCSSKFLAVDYYLPSYYLIINYYQYSLLYTTLAVFLCLPIWIIPLDSLFVDDHCV